VIRMTPPLPDTNWLARAGAMTPDAVALVEDDGTEITYCELDALADEAAAKLQGRIGLGRGDITIVAVGAVDLRLLATLWGAWRSGVTPMVIDEASPLLRAGAEPVKMQWGEMPAASTDPHDRLHSVVLTSGTGGLPRPVKLTHGNVAAAVAASIAHLGNTADDRWLLSMPLFHVGGLSILWRSAAVGGTVVVHNGFDAERAARAMKGGSVSLASLVPTMLYRILVADSGPYVGMKAVLLGGSAADPRLVENGLGAGLPILQTYGMTEACSQVATVALGQAEHAAGAAARPLEGMKVTIDGGDGGIGEIVVDGPAVSPGYLGEPPRSGGHRTGDLGYIDDTGRLVVLGRTDDMIVTGGENVYPSQVAGVLAGHRLVDRVEVVGVPDSEWGQAVIAIVVGNLEAGSQIERWAQERLAKHQVPKRWVFVDEMPLRPSGKVDRIALRELAEL